MTQIEYEFETALNVPEVVDAIIVRVSVSPATASCIAYGFNAEGNILPVKMPGGDYETELPFCNPQIYVKFLDGLEGFSIAPLGWRDCKRLPARIGGAA